MGFDGNYLINTGGVIIALVLIMGILKLISITVKALKVLKILDAFNKVYKKVFWDGISTFVALFSMEFIITSML